MSSNYIKPDLNGQRVLWKGRRYWVIEITPDLPFEYADSSLGDMVIFDGLYGVIVATAKRLEDGTYESTLTVAHAEITSHADTIRDLLMALKEDMKLYAKSCSK